MAIVVLVFIFPTAKGGCPHLGLLVPEWFINIRSETLVARSAEMTHCRSNRPMRLSILSMPHGMVAWSFNASFGHGWQMTDYWGGSAVMVPTWQMPTRREGRLVPQ
jgi:hypothetical protein